MPLTPADVQNKQFRGAFRGYNEEEVDAFLDEVEAELGRLLSENAELRRRIEGGEVAPAAVAPAAAPAPAPEPVRMQDGEGAALRTLLLAQRTADEAIAEARAEAEQIVNEARELGARLEREANEHQAARLGEIERRRQALETHIEELRAFEREYRTRLKAYLESQLRDLDGRAAAPAVTGGGAPAPAAPTPQVAAPPAQSAIESGPTGAAAATGPQPAVPAVDGGPAPTLRGQARGQGGGAPHLRPVRPAAGDGVTPQGDAGER